MLTIQGENIGHWTRTQRSEWSTLSPAQQWLLAEVLGLEPLDEPQPTAVQAPAPQRSRAEM